MKHVKIIKDLNRQKQILDAMKKECYSMLQTFNRSEQNQTNSPFKFGNMKPASNLYIGFILTIFCILTSFVLYVVFLHPFAKFVSIFMSVSIWYAIIPIAPLVLFISGFIYCLRKERNPDN